MRAKIRRGGVEIVESKYSSVIKSADNKRLLLGEKLANEMSLMRGSIMRKFK